MERSQVCFPTFSPTIKIYYPMTTLMLQLSIALAFHFPLQTPGLLFLSPICYLQDHRTASDLLLSIPLPNLFNKSANHLQAERLAEHKIKHVL